MSPATQALILQIVTTALQITAQGQWRANAQITTCSATSVGAVLRPASTDFSRPAKEWPEPEVRYGWVLNDDEDKDLAELQALLDWLRDFLTITPEEAAA